MNRCVVCGSEIISGQPHYANLWEESVKKHPCCTERCARSFDADKHWIPYKAPTTLPSDTVETMLEASRNNLHGGQNAVNDVRHLLLAGVPADRIRSNLRTAIDEADARGSSNHRGSGRDLALASTVFGVIVAFLTGWFAMFFVNETNHRRSRIDREKIRQAEAELDAWAARFL